MDTTTLPSNEAARLEALRSYAILDTPPEEDFDALARLAAYTCKCPMSVVNLLDADRQWFKASVGLTIKQTDLSVAFCTMALHGKGETVVLPDVRKHRVLGKSPSVVGAPHLRFYACVPLINPDGYVLGTLAVMDTKVHHPKPEEIAGLETLARQAMAQLELRRQNLSIANPHGSETDAKSLHDERMNLVADAATDAMWDWDLSTDTMWWSEGMEQLLGMPSSRTLDKPEVWSSRLHPDDCKRVLQSISDVLQKQDVHWSAEYRFKRGDGGYIWVLDRGFVVRDQGGTAMRMVGGITDISHHKKAELLAQREARNHAELLHVQQRISSLDMPLSEVLQLVAQTMLDQTSGSGSMVELLEEDQLVAQASAGVLVRRKGDSIAAEKSIIWPMAQQGRTVLCNDTSTTGWDMVSLPHRHGVQSIIAVPLRAQDKVIGILKVTSGIKNVFSGRDVAHMEILAESLGAMVQLRRIAAQLHASEQQYRMLFDAHPHPMWVYECASMRLLAVNMAMVSHYGYQSEMLLQMTVPQLWAGPLYHDDSHNNTVVQQHVTALGVVIDVEVTTSSINFNGVPAKQVLAIDVTERVRNQRELARMGRAQRLLSACNETLVRATDEKTLLQAICDVAVNIGGYRMGWVGFARDDERKSIEPVAHAGYSQHYLESIQLSWSESDPVGHGPAGTAIRTGKAVIVQDIRRHPDKGDWSERMLEHGFHGIICLPLQGQGQGNTFGLLYLYAPDILYISAEETLLLQELANDLAFGITSLRAHQAEQRLQSAVLKMAAAVSASTGTAFFVQLARNMAQALDAQASCVARLLPCKADEIPVASVLGAVLNGEEVLPHTHYTLHGTPSRRLMTDRQYLVLDNNWQMYPDAPMTQFLKARGYAGQQLCNSDGEVIGIVFVLFKQAIANRDFVASTLQIFAARAQAEINRQTSDNRIRHQASLLDKAQDAIIVRDLQQRITFWNKSAERMYGWTQLQVLGQSAETLLYKDPTEFRKAVKTVMEQGEWNGEIVQIHRDGHPLDVEGRWTLVHGEDGEPDSILSINTDIGQRKATEREIQRLAFYDPLTGLPNRMLLMDRMHQALANAQRRHTGGALLFIDMDNFKTLNDTLGHDQGDLLLQQVAQRLNTCVRVVDTVARLGGDEFVVMLEELSIRPNELAVQARAIGEKIVSTLSTPYALGAYQYRSTPSIGIAPFHGEQSSVGELLKQADLAMYQAKTAGRNTLRFFDPEMQSIVSARAALETDLRAALAHEEFMLYYQVQVNAVGEFIGVEALLRWTHPERGAVSPTDFIPLAEETGLILSLGRWVLHTACKLLATWQNDPALAHLTMAVNVSSRQFRHTSFVDEVARVLAITGAPPEQLKLELTESVLVEDMEATIATMSALRSYGVCFSLDDFGTGYSSLGYLKRMPLNQLKIDQSFVQDLLTDPNDAAIVNTIIGLSRSLGLAVIAEGVETQEQHAMLSRYGCQFFQGYLFSRPISQQALDQLLRSAIAH